MYDADDSALASERSIAGDMITSRTAGLPRDSVGEYRAAPGHRSEHVNQTAGRQTHWSQLYLINDKLNSDLLSSPTDLFTADQVMLFMRLRPLTWVTLNPIDCTLLKQDLGDDLVTI